MTKKGREILHKKKWIPSKKQLVTVSIIVVFLIATVSVILFLYFQSSEVAFSLNAAIIDQLGGELPNPTFAENVTTILTMGGFNVAYYNKTLNVDFFRGIAKNNYGIILLRVHSALREDAPTVDFFTSEPFNEYRHVQEQENGLVVEGILNYSGVVKEYFAITSKFIENLESKFPKSVVIAMGCWSLKPGLEQMANSFIEKGAKAYIGWTGMVGYLHTDNETVKLMKKLLIDNETLGEAIDDLKLEPDPLYGSTMELYPLAARTIRISDLIAREKSPMTFGLPSTILNCYPKFVLKTIDCKSKDFRAELDQAGWLNDSTASKR